MCSLLAPLLLVLACAVSSAQAGLFHAQCQATYTVLNASCTDVLNTLVDTAKKMPTQFPAVREPTYAVTLQQATALKLTHTTPVHKYVDDVTIKSTQTGANCVLSAHSQSRPVSVLDKCTNFCNSWNLFRAVQDVQVAVGSCTPGCPPKPADFEKVCDQY